MYLKSADAVVQFFNFLGQLRDHLLLALDFIGLLLYFILDRFLSLRGFFVLSFKFNKSYLKLLYTFWVHVATWAADMVNGGWETFVRAHVLVVVWN